VSKYIFVFFKNITRIIYCSICSKLDVVLGKKILQCKYRSIFSTMKHQLFYSSSFSVNFVTLSINYSSILIDNGGYLLKLRSYLQLFLEHS